MHDQPPAVHVAAQFSQSVGWDRLRYREWAALKAKLALLEG
jgi:hypothetical protein